MSDRVKIIYDPANSIYGEDANTSIITGRPNFISLEGMDSGNLTSVIVQVRLHPDGIWHDYINVNISVPNALVEVNNVFNEVQIVRNGTDNFIVYASR